MDRRIRAEFGVEGGGEDMAILDEDGLAVVFGEDGDSLPDCFDDWSSNKNHFERLFGEGGRAKEDVAGKLAAVTVAENRHIKEFQRILRGILNLSGEENRSSASAEDGVLF